MCAAGVTSARRTSEARGARRVRADGGGAGPPYHHSTRASATQRFGLHFELLGVGVCLRLGIMRVARLFSDIRSQTALPDLVMALSIPDPEGAQDADEV